MLIIFDSDLLADSVCASPPSSVSSVTTGHVTLVSQCNVVKRVGTLLTAGWHIVN